MLRMQFLHILKQFLQILKVETPQCDVSNKKNIETSHCGVSTLFHASKLSHFVPCAA